MVNIIEARAILSASDKTGGVFGNIAAKIRGMNNAAVMANRAVGNSAMMATNASRTATMANSAILAGASRVFAPAAIAAGAAKAYGNFAQADLQIRRIGITADATEAQVSKLGASLRKTASDTGQSYGKVTKGLESLVAGGMDLKEAIPAIPAIATTAQAAGAEVEDMATTTLALNQNLKISTDKMQNAFDILVKGGKAGKFELKDMARYFPSIAPAAVAAGMKGEEGLMRIVAALQTIRNGTGTTEEAAASMQNIFAKMESEQTVKKFKDFGIDLRKEMTKARKEGKDLLEVFTDLSEKALKGDLSKVPQLFSDMEFARGMRALLSYRDLNKKVMGELRHSAGSTAQDFAKVMNTPAIAMERMKEAADRLVNSLGAAIDKVSKAVTEGGLTGYMGRTATDLETISEKGYQGFLEDKLAKAKAEIPDDKIKDQQATVARLNELADKARARGSELPAHRLEQLGVASMRLIELQNAARAKEHMNRTLFGPDDPEANMWRKSGDGESVTTIGKKQGAQGMPPVQPLDDAKPVKAEVTGTVQGQAEVKVTVEASSEFMRVVESVKNAVVNLNGKLANGPGSTGKSSPDAAPGNTGYVSIP